MLRSIDTLKPDGTWSAIDYTSGCTARRSSWPASGHWSRLLEMTVAYRGGLPRYKNNAHLRSAIHRAMGYWFDHDYSTIGDGSCMDREQFPAHHCPCGTPGLWGPNWYSNVILIPTRVGKVCILLRQELSDTELAKCTTMTARAYAPFYRDPKPGYLSGANVMDIAVIGIMAALLENDRSGNETRIADAYGRVHSQTLVQSEDRVDGIKPDGSFQQHGGLIYDASAHVILLALNVGCSSNSFIQLSLLALGTQFQAKKEVQQSFGRWFEGARWMTYTNVMNNVVHWDLSVIGRFISYPVADGRASADLRMDLSQVLKLGKAWSQRDLIEFGTQLTGSADNSANSGGLVGSRMFWNSDYMVHRTAETVTTVKMVSTRTTTSECVNSENPYGFHLSDGVTYTYSTGAEYEDIFAGLDYSIPPGITTDYAATKLECATTTRAGADSYAGGVEADDVAMAAMRYLNPLSQSFGFYKAWFFFPNNVQHVLVANVQQYSQHSHPAFSVLDQRLRSGDVYLNGQPISEGGNFTETNTLWHGGTGYTFPPDQAISTPVSVCLQSKSGDWSKIGTSKRPSSIKDTFTAWLVHTPSSRTPTTHSSDPNTSAPIEYSVFPATRSNSEFENKAARYRPRTIVNSEVVSAAMDSHATVLGAAFWKPLGGSVSVKEMGVGLEVDRGVVVMVKFKDEGRTKGRIYVADPTHGSGTVTVKVNWLGQAISQRSAGEGCSGSECPGLKRTVGRPVSSTPSEISKLGPNMSPEARLVQLNDHLQPRFLISTSMRRIGAYIERKTSTFKAKLKSAAASDVLGTSTLPSLSEALKTLQDSAGVFPPLQAAIGGLIACPDSKHRSEFESLARKLTLLSTSLNRHIKTSKSTHVSEFLERMAASVEEQVNIISSKQDRGIGGHFRRAEQDEKDIIEGYRRIAEILEELQTEASLKMWTIAEQQLADSRLEALSPAHAAAYNSSLSEEVNRRSCTEGTRANILLELNEWSLDSSKPNIFWMNGMAGTGKTTIAYTFAQSLRARGTLGASFFCTRTSDECRDVRRIVPAIAYQLAQCSPAFRSAVLSVLEQDLNIKSQSITSQCERLIKEPLSQVKSKMTKELVVVIDALDECSSADGVGIILDVLFRVAPNLPVKFFVTSRPEPDIRLRVEAHSDQRRSMCVLHDIDQSLVKADIKLYLRDELPKSAVSESHMTQLANLSGSLFIYAATVVRYIRRKGNKIDLDRLEVVLSSSSKSGYQNADIDRLYTTILDAAINDPEHEPEEQEQMRLMLWTAICTREPVNIDTLAALTGITATKADILLQPLYSVLHVSQGTNVVSTLHASFPDYMFDEARSARFYCDEAKHSQLVSEHCFDIMKQQLRFNICSLETSFIADNQVEDLEARIARSISPTLSYAAHHWGDHVSRSVPCEVVRAKLEDFLSHRLLFWMEVLSLKRTTSTGINTLSIVKPWLVAKGGSPDSIKFLDDAWIFVSTVAAGSVSQSTPHIYISALAFCHPSSSVYKQYGSSARGLLSLTGSAIEHQSALLATWRMESSPTSLVPSPDGVRFAIGFDDGVVCVVHAHNGAVVLGPLEGHTKWVGDLAFSPDGSMLASVSGDGTILVRDAQTGNRIYDVIKGHEGGVTSVCFSPDGKHVLSGSYDGTTRMWDGGNGSLIPNSIKQHPSSVLCTAFSPDGKLVACGLWNDECPIVVYDASTGKSLPFPFDANQSSVFSIAFSPNGNNLVTGHQSGDLRVWSLHNGTATYSPPKVHDNRITSIGFSLLGDKLVTGSGDGCVYIWDVENGYSNPCLLGTHDNSVHSAAFSPDGTRVASCSRDGVKMWNPLHSTSSHTPKWKAPTKAVLSVAISPDGSRIAAASGDNAIYMFNARDGTAAVKPLVAHTNWISSIAFSPNGRYLASCGNDHAICLWDGTSGKLLSGPLRGHQGWVLSISFSPDGKRIVSASRDKTIRMWDVGDGTLTAIDLVGTHEDMVFCATFSPDGGHIVSGCRDGKIRMWDSHSLSLVFDPFGSQWHKGSIYSVTFSPDGQLVASGSDDGAICVFDSRSGDLVLGPLKGHERSVQSVVFSPHGSHIVSGSDDGSVRVWVAKNGAPACEPLRGHQEGVTSVTYSPDGRHIVSGSLDSTIRVWKAPGGGVVSDLSHSASFASDERETHRAIAGGLTVSQDGWARNRDSQLLFWAPSNIRRVFPALETVYTIGPEGILQTDYSQSLFLGDEWHRCYVS
ncbi:Polysaccharide lyase family 8, N terminal alpha-helical domain, partial [Rhizoctonia solani]